MERIKEAGKQVGSLLAETAREWLADKATTYAGDLSYRILLALSPLVVIAAGIVGLIYQDSDALDDLIARAGDFLGEASADALQVVLDNMTRPGASFLAVVVGGLILLYTAGGAFRALRKALNAIWNVEPAPLRADARRLLTFIANQLVMLGLVALSLWKTPAGVRQDNRFNYHAILEVAALFIGIFICMQVPIAILNAKGADLPIKEPWHFFWATGGLSSFLDNAPTYVVFFETAKVLPSGSEALAVQGGAIAVPLLIAISLGSVFMGAMTYIGNGPNFMVKSIAEQAGIRMPSFFGYMLYSIAILIPLFIVVTLVFL